MKKLTVAAFAAGLMCTVGAQTVSADEPMSKLYPSISNAPPQSVVYVAASAMEFFRQAAASGQWSMKMIDGFGGKEMQMSPAYDSAMAPGTLHMIAAGSVVEQRYNPGKPDEMTIMYYQDGPSKMYLTHYCAARNVPTLAFEKSNLPGELRFKFAGGANLNPVTDTYFRDTTFHIVNQDTYEQAVTTVDKGKASVHYERWTRSPAAKVAKN